jgi:DNA transposition AAA+ family ATPase
LGTPLNRGEYSLSLRERVRVRAWRKVEMSTTNGSSIEFTRQRLNQFCLENPLTTNTDIAKNIGYSPSYISQFKNNKFPTKETETEFAIRIENYLDNQETTLKEAIGMGDLKFALTTASQKIFKTIDYCVTEHVMGVVTGDAGSGKTFTSEEYKRKNPNAILIQLPPLITLRSLQMDICKSLKITDHYYNYEMFNSIVSKLKGTNRLLILDEAHKLKTDGLELIRRIHDFTQIGVLLLGEDILIGRLTGPRGKLKQLYSRIGINISIANLTVGDIKAILRVNYPEAMEFANTFLQVTKNNPRSLKMLIKQVKHTIKDTGEKLSDDLIDAAAGQLLT